MSRKGGKAIASGSYGCVFRPALKCKSDGDEKQKNSVSKLMYNEDANEEMDEMIPIMKAIQKGTPLSTARALIIPAPTTANAG